MKLLKSLALALLLLASPALAQDGSLGGLGAGTTAGAINGGIAVDVAGGGLVTGTSPSSVCPTTSTPPTIAMTASTGTASGSATATGTTVDIPAGTTVVVQLVGLTANNSFSSLVDSQSNHYNIVQASATASVLQAAEAYIINVPHIPVGTTFTAVTSGAVTWAIKGVLISCTTGPLDAALSANQSTTSTSNTLTTGTLNSSNEIAYGYNATNPNGGGYTTATGFTSLSSLGNNNNLVEYLVQSGSTGAISFNPTWVTPTQSSAVLLTFYQTPCAQYTSLAARMDGGQNVAAVMTLICGLVADGNYARFDGLYVFDTNSTTNALLNWAQNAFNLTQVGTVNFSANNGFTSDGTTGYLSPSFNPSTAGGNWSLNNASIGVCDRTSRTAIGSVPWELGAFDGTNVAAIQLLSTSSTNTWYIDQSTAESSSSSNVQGAWTLTRTASANGSISLNGGALTAGTHASSALPNSNFSILTLANSLANITTDQIGYAFMGAGLTSTQVTNIHTRLHTYDVAVGASGC